MNAFVYHQLQNVNRLLDRWMEKRAKEVRLPANIQIEEDIPYLAHTAAYGNGNNGTLGGFVVLKEEDMDNIYRAML